VNEKKGASMRALGAVATRVATEVTGTNRNKKKKALEISNDFKGL